MTPEQIEQLIRDEYSGDRNPRPDLLAKRISENSRPTPANAGQRRG